MLDLGLQIEGDVLDGRGGRLLPQHLRRALQRRHVLVRDVGQAGWVRRRLADVASSELRLNLRLAAHPFDRRQEPGRAELRWQRARRAVQLADVMQDQVRPAFRFQPLLRGTTRLCACVARTQGREDGGEDQHGSHGAGVAHCAPAGA